jgi:hypothetical protein
MAVQLRLGVVGAACAFAAHTAYVYTERAKAPTGRLLSFSPGSQDDIVADSLHAGALVMFSRDCVLYGCAGAAACAARKEATGRPYDHFGVVVMHRGAPHVLEHTAAGPRCRRYDARVRCSRAQEVVVRPLAVPLTPEQEAASAAFVAAKVGSPSAAEPTTSLATVLSPAAGLVHLADIARLPLQPSHNPSASFAEEYYVHLGVLHQGHDEKKTRAGLADVRGQALAPVRLKPAIWVRDLWAGKRHS